MNVYYNNSFKGHYPVGTSAVIVARDRIEAFNLLQAELKKHGLNLEFTETNPSEFVQLDLTSSHAVVLQDGDY